MKTIVEIATQQSKYLLSDDAVVLVTSVQIDIPNAVVGDLNSTNAVVYENVTPPEDWIGCKYLFDGTDWTLNPNWVDPRPVEVSA